MKKAVSDFAASRYEPGSSRVWDSILRGISLFTSGRDTSNIVRALVFISDGRDTSSAITRELAGEIALEDDVQLFAVGVVDVYQEEDLAQMVESTGGVYYPTEALIALEEQLRLVISDLVGQYSVSYITLRRRGVYKVRVQVDLPTAKGEFETKALDMASFFGLDNVGRIAIDPLTVDRERAEVRTFARALHVPRNVNRFRFRLDTSKEISVGIIPAAEGGLLSKDGDLGSTHLATMSSLPQPPWLSASPVCYSGSRSLESPKRTWRYPSNSTTIYTPGARASPTPTTFWSESVWSPAR